MKLRCFLETSLCSIFLAKRKWKSLKSLGLCNKDIYTHFFPFWKVNLFSYFGYILVFQLGYSCSRYLVHIEDKRHRKSMLFILSLFKIMNLFYQTQVNVSNLIAITSILPIFVLYLQLFQNKVRNWRINQSLKVCIPEA